jgi:beta-xylosidase
MKTKLAFLAMLSLPFLPLVADTMPGRAPHSANPILPGYYADPSVMQDGEKSYIYATLDPWGDKTLGCWESSDFKNWTYRELNWPTKQDCTSPTSKAAGVWAPSVVKGKDGKFHMVVSVGSEVWVGVADHPLGPWRNALGDHKPFITWDYKPGFHMIDAEYFLDDDETASAGW